MAKKETKVPFKPAVMGDKDLNYVDIEFKSEMPKDTPVQQSSIANKVNFPGFTYNPEAQLKRDSTSIASTNS